MQPQATALYLRDRKHLHFNGSLLDYGLSYIWTEYISGVYSRSINTLGGVLRFQVLAGRDEVLEDRK